MTHTPRPRWPALFAFVGLLIALPVGAEGPSAPAPELEEAAASVFGQAVRIDCHSSEAEGVCQAALTEPNYWNDANAREYSDRQYDEIRLKPVETGFVPMITGEGSMDFDADVVADVVFNNQDQLPARMDGAKAVEYLGRGYDETVGAEYTDAYFMLDLTLFYATFTQRMYKRSDGDKTVLWFEKLTPDMVGSTKWTAYQARQVEIEEALEFRWAFSSILRLEDIYGMFIISKGDTHTSRITFISKMEFGEDAGMMAKMGSQMKSVLRSGLKSGFIASVQIAESKQAAKK